jgi:hypothetical protein
MHIDDDHMYHGAALIQIAEQKEFKAINAFHDINARGAFQINNNIGVYIKHALNATNAHKEYVFAFSAKNISEIENLKDLGHKVFIVLVCIKVRQICCLTIDQFDKLISERERARGESESQYTILVTAHANQQFRVYVNQPRKKNRTLGEILVKRKSFPSIIFA